MLTIYAFEYKEKVIYPRKKLEEKRYSVFIVKNKEIYLLPLTESIFENLLQSYYVRCTNNFINGLKSLFLYFLFIRLILKHVL